MARKAKSSGKSRGSSRHGGRRAGAGRKPKAVHKLRAEIAAEANEVIGDALPQLIKNLIKLANGGYLRVEERHEPAGFVMLRLPLRDKTGKPMFDDKGKPILAMQPAFPDKPPDEPVMIERKVSVADCDRGANIYLIDRLLGRPPENQKAPENQSDVTIDPRIAEAARAEALKVAEQLEKEKH